MPVSARVREIETEIDGRIASLEIWQQPKARLLEQIMRTYRDAIELTVILHLFFETGGADLDLSFSDVAALFAEEQRQRAGALWALKWASQFCLENGAASEATPESLVDLLALGAKYESFVDVLKAANRDAVAIRIDETAKALVCYEGEQATMWDTSIVVQQRLTAPLARQISLTEDGDQMTAGWTAGGYRRVTRMLTDAAAKSENDIVVDLAALLGQDAGEISVPQPTVVWLKAPTEPEDSRVFNDLVLPTDGRVKSWKLVSLLDTPVVKMGSRYCALSSDLRAISLIDKHMLRLAALIDPDRYSLAATLREDRMIAKCRAALESATSPWRVGSRAHYTNPPQEADVVGQRQSEALVVELKSTLRPETPWEVHKRNEDIVHGIRQTKALVDRGVAGVGFVLTDGYRGDYACWAEALSNDVTIGTLDDLAEIALDPVNAALSLKEKVGLHSEASGPHERLPDRDIELMGWKIRLIDGAAPSAVA